MRTGPLSYKGMAVLLPWRVAATVAQGVCLFTIGSSRPWRQVPPRPAAPPRSHVDHPGPWPGCGQASRGGLPRPALRAERRTASGVRRRPADDFRHRGALELGQGLVPATARHEVALAICLGIDVLDQPETPRGQIGLEPGRIEAERVRL